MIGVWNQASATISSEILVTLTSGNRNRLRLSRKWVRSTVRVLRWSRGIIGLGLESGWAWWEIGESGRLYGSNSPKAGDGLMWGLCEGAGKILFWELRTSKPQVSELDSGQWLLLRQEKLGLWWRGGGVAVLEWKAQFGNGKFGITKGMLFCFVLFYHISNKTHTSAWTFCVHLYLPNWKKIILKGKIFQGLLNMKHPVIRKGPRGAGFLSEAAIAPTWTLGWRSRDGPGKAASVWRWELQNSEDAG